MNAVCLIVDRLQCGYLGCYGNAWARTSAFDRLACESFLFDQAMIDSPDLTQLYRAYWQGRHALAPASGGRSLPCLLSERGVQTALITDEAALAHTPLASDFGQTILQPCGNAATADDASETQAAGLFATAVDWLAAARPPFLLWVHSQGLAASWDAPHEFRQAFQDDEAVAVPAFVEPPSRPLPDDADPDDVLGIRWAYAGQVSLLDVCLQGLLEALAALPSGDDTLLLVTSARGLPLGEHGWLGPPPGGAEHEAAREAASEELYNELVHVPLLLKLPQGVGAAARSPALVQPADVEATLRDWWGLPAETAGGGGASLLPIVRDHAATVRDRACIASPDGERAIRTPAWYLRWRPGGDATKETERPAQLFVKPDDCHDVNDVADRCPEVVGLLLEAADEFAAVIASNEPHLKPLDDVLATGLE